MVTTLDTFSSPEYLKFLELQVAVERQIRAVFSKVVFRKDGPTRFSVMRTEIGSSMLSVELEDHLQSIRFGTNATNLSHFGIGRSDEGEVCLCICATKISVAEAVDEILASFLIEDFLRIYRKDF